MTIIIILVTSIVAISAGLLAVSKHDHQSKTYRLSFPPDLDADRIVAWLHSISGTLRVNGPARFFGVPVLSLEVWATDKGITHRLKIPWRYEPLIKPKLESHVAGIRIMPEPKPPRRTWVYAMEVGVRHSERLLRVRTPADMAVTVLSNFGALNSGETLMMQWVITPAVPTHPPVHETARSHEMSIGLLLNGNRVASRDEINERRAKLEEPNMLAVLRVGAVAGTKIRAQYLVRSVMSSLDAARGPSTHFYKRFVAKRDLQSRIEHGSPVVNFPIQVNATELASLIGWPVGSPLINGLPAPMSRYLPANQTIPTEGRIIGHSTFPGAERKIAVAYTEARKHTWVVGATGVGKTTTLANMMKQDIANGYGVVLIENKGDLFRSALDYIPPGRLKDVIVFDASDRAKPVGFNILNQGNPAVVIDELIALFNHWFGTSPSLWMQEVMFHGLHTLAQVPGATFSDLASLVRPMHEELRWRDNIIRGLTDSQLRSFWQRFDNQPPARQDEIARPLLSRIYPLMRSNLKNIIGQSESSFQMSDVLQNGKILLVNLAGIESDAGALMGTLLVNALWHAAQTTSIPRGSFLYLDEFQDMLKLPIDPQDMLAKARGFGLGMVLSHQHLGQLTTEMADAVMSNARTKIAFQASHKDAGKIAQEFGNTVSAADFQQLPAYEAIARVSTTEGVSAPLTLATYPAAHGYGNARRVKEVSRENFGRDAASVEREIAERHKISGSGSKRPDISGWGS